jgi:hypothetical protein
MVRRKAEWEGIRANLNIQFFGCLLDLSSEALAASGSLAPTTMPPEKNRDFLNLGLQRPDQIDPGYGPQLANLLKADLGLAARNNDANRLGRDHSALGPDRRFP